MPTKAELRALVDEYKAKEQENVLRREALLNKLISDAKNDIIFRAQKGLTMSSLFTSSASKEFRDTFTDAFINGVKAEYPDIDVIIYYDTTISYEFSWKH
jgi:hypothetical protein